MVKKSKYNIYSGGGPWSGKGMLNSVKNASGSDIAGGIAGAASLASGALGNLADDNTKVEQADVSASSKADLLAQMNDFTGLHLGREKTGFGAVLGDVLGGVSGGAGAGSIGGPMGAAIGAGAGALLGGITGIFGRKKRNRQRAEKENTYNNQMGDQYAAANDSLSNSSMTNILSNYAAYGGDLFAYGGNFSNGLTSFGSGGSHEENPYGGIPQGIGKNNKPNLVEEGETKWNDYIFSNRLKLDKDFAIENKLPKNTIGKTYAKASESISKEASERPNDPISLNGLRANLDRLKESQESYKALEEYDNNMNETINEMGLGDGMYAKGGGIHIKKENRGKFTASAKRAGMGVQAFASKVLANKGKYSSTLVKRANFAKNASKWHHALGGSLMIDNSYITPGGSTVVGKDNESSTYATGGAMVSRNVNNRFNVYPNGISVFDWGGNLANTHIEAPKNYHTQGANIYAIGSPSEGLNILGADAQSYPGAFQSSFLTNPNLSKPFRVVPETNSQPVVNSTSVESIGSTVPTSSPKGSTKSTTPVPKKGSEYAYFGSVAPSTIDFKAGNTWVDTFANQMGKIQDKSKVQANLDAAKGYVQTSYQKPTTQGEGQSKFGDLASNIGMFAPAIANFAQALKDQNATPETMHIARVHNNSADRQDDNLPYNPIDREYLANKIRSQAGASRRAITDTSGGNRAAAQAGLVASDRNTMNAIGEAYFKTADVNRNRLIQSKEFANRARAINSQSDRQTQMFNSQIGAQEDQINMANRAAARNAARQGFLNVGQSIGEISRYLGDRRKVGNMFGLYNEEGEYVGQSRKSKGGKLNKRK